MKTMGWDPLANLLGGGASSGFNFGNAGIVGALGSGLGGILGQLFSNPSWKNPANAAMPYLDKIPDELKPLFQPYMDAGNNALGQYSGTMSDLATPQGATNNYNALASGFTTSPGYDFQKQQDTQAMQAMSAANGTAGTPASQAALANTVNGLASSDFNNYMGTVGGYQDTGLSGLKDLTHLGFDASSEYGQALLKQLMEQAGLSYMGADNQNRYNQSQSNMWGSLGSAIGGIGGAAAGLML